VVKKLKVLIIGGYGFIGSHVAERFYKEGYEVHIIDDLSNSNNYPIHIKHKFYEKNAQDISCYNFFSNTTYDVVVFAAYKYYLDFSSSVDSFAANCGSLLNILDLCSKYSVNKFIFISSTSVYGEPKTQNKEENSVYEDKKIRDGVVAEVKREIFTEETILQPESLDGIFYYQMESLITEWSRVKGLNIVILRTTNVYGPRQHILKSNSIGDMIYSIQMDVDFKAPSSPYVDLIYVTDLVEAIYLSAGTFASGIYNVTQDNSTSSVVLSTIISSLKDGVSKKCLISYETKYSNARIKKELEWVYLYETDVGIAQTIKWFNENISIQDLSELRHKKAFEHSKDKSNMTRKYWFQQGAFPYIENLLLAFISFQVSNFFSIFSSFNLDIRILYIIIMSIFYGMEQAMIASVLSCILYIIERTIMEVDVISIAYDMNILVVMIRYLIVGACIGYVIDSKEAKLYSKQEEVDKLTVDYNYLKNFYDENILSSEQLKDRLLAYEDSYGKILNIISVLNTLEPEIIIFQSFQVINEILKVEDISIYLLNKPLTYMRRVGSYGNFGGILPKSVMISEQPVFENLIKTGETYVNREMNSGLPAMIAPVESNHAIIGFVMIERMEFDKMSLYSYNLFKVVVKLISEAISKAYAYTEAVHDAKFLKTTNVINPNEFKKILEIKKQLRQQYNAQFTLLKIVQSAHAISFKDLAFKISTLIRESDRVGLDHDYNFLVLLSDTTESEVEPIIKRFQENGIHTAIFEESE
jgi:nucleoside-diphosphate-sugar epimerase